LTVRIKNLDIGLESISRWRVEDEVHLPKEGPIAPAFLPLYRPLQEIIRRPSLDERLPQQLQPSTLDPELLEPATLTEARIDARSLLGDRARHTTGAERKTFQDAAALLDDGVVMDDEIRSALAALLRG
jgi:hypothetical protein